MNRWLMVAVILIGVGACLQLAGLIFNIVSGH